jgi:hypothetical protein
LLPTARRHEEDALNCPACKQIWNEMKLADDKRLEAAAATVVRKRGTANGNGHGHAG